eukprot:GHVR01123515.1.p1 GENE.GHVR01123515.1~~GHVR01123515.1.p1  ORF type:complete len:474 (+),score=20.71 GHVR01123515.1:163-1584(+)
MWARYLEYPKRSAWKNIRVICDEYHEGAIDIIDTIHRMPLECEVIFMSATPAYHILEKAGVGAEAMLRTGFGSPFDIQDLVIDGVTPLEAVMTVIKQHPDFASRLLIIVPQLQVCRSLQDSLQSVGVHTSVVDAATANTPNHGHLIATQVADSGMNFPGDPISCVVDSGIMMTSHKGQMLTRVVTSMLSAQRRGRTGRNCNGLYVNCRQPSDKPVIHYPDFETYLRDPSFWSEWCDLKITVGAAASRLQVMSGNLGICKEVERGMTYNSVAFYTRCLLRCNEHRELTTDVDSLKAQRIPQRWEDLFDAYPFESVAALKDPESLLTFFEKKPMLITVGQSVVRCGMPSLLNDGLSYNGEPRQHIREIYQVNKLECSLGDSHPAANFPHGTCVVESCYTGTEAELIGNTVAGLLSSIAKGIGMGDTDDTALTVFKFEARHKGEKTHNLLMSSLRHNKIVDPKGWLECVSIVTKRS